MTPEMANLVTAQQRVDAGAISDAERRGAVQVLREIAMKNPSVPDGDEWPVCYFT